MSIDPKTMEEEDYFPATKTFVENYMKISTPGSVPKHWIGFSYIRSEYFELGLKFYETEMKSKSDHTSDHNVQLFSKNIVVIEEEWFADTNLTDGAIFPTALIKRAKSRINQKLIFHVTQSDAYAKLQ